MVAWPTLTSRCFTRFLSPLSPLLTCPCTRSGTRSGTSADQQVARQALWNAFHASDVARLEFMVIHLNERSQQTGYAQDVGDVFDAERALARLKAAGPRTSL